MITCSKYKLPPKRRNKLLLLFRIDLQKIQELGKKYPWKKPKKCPSCNSIRLWGHGYVIRYFYKYTFGIWMKRWRCPDCGAVHAAKPCEYPPGFQYPAKIMKRTLLTKLGGEPFPGEIPRQNQQYWINFATAQLHIDTGDIRKAEKFISDLEPDVELVTANTASGEDDETLNIKRELIRLGILLAILNALRVLQ